MPPVVPALNKATHHQLTHYQPAFLTLSIPSSGSSGGHNLKETLARRPPLPLKAPRENCFGEIRGGGVSWGVEEVVEDREERPCELCFKWCG